MHSRDGTHMAAKPDQQPFARQIQGPDTIRGCETRKMPGDKCPRSSRKRHVSALAARTTGPGGAPAARTVWIVRAVWRSHVTTISAVRGGGGAVIYPAVRPRSSPLSNLTPPIWVVALLGVGGGVGRVRARGGSELAGRAWRRAISCSRVGRRGSSDLTSGEASNLSRQGWFW